MGGGRYGIIKGNRHNKEINSHIDFFVGPNGGVLTAKHKHWIGVSKRTSLLRKAKNKKLRNVINQMFRKGSFIGDGGTASALIFEKRTGLLLSPKGHIQKARESITRLNKILKKENLTATETKLIRRLKKKLNRAIIEWEK